jgi:hypothetical protein
VDCGRRVFLALQLSLGPAVLASYAWGFAHWPETVRAMWGGVPEGARAAYELWMFVAAAGYLALSGAFLRSSARWPARNRAYAATLAGSVLWMPLTKLCLEGSLAFAWVAFDLWIVAAGSLALLWEARALRSAIALAGAAAFCVQTVLLDAVVWPLLWITGR